MKKPTSDWHIKYEVFAHRQTRLESSTTENINGATPRYAKYLATYAALKTRIGDTDVLRVTLENLHTKEVYRREFQVGFLGGKKTAPVGDWHK